MIQYKQIKTELRNKINEVEDHIETLKKGNHNLSKLFVYNSFIIYLKKIYLKYFEKDNPTVLMTKDNPVGFHLENLLDILCWELGEKDNNANSSGFPPELIRIILSNNQEITLLLQQAKKYQESTIKAIDAYKRDLAHA